VGTWARRSSALASSGSSKSSAHSAKARLEVAGSPWRAVSAPHLQVANSVQLLAEPRALADKRPFSCHGAVAYQDPDRHCAEGRARRGWIGRLRSGVPRGITFDWRMRSSAHSGPGAIMGRYANGESANECCARACCCSCSQKSVKGSRVNQLCEEGTVPVVFGIP
jgi:hypothetical protein